MSVTINEIDFLHAVDNVVKNLNGISNLYDSQLEVLRSLVMDTSNLFVTAPTSSGKTLPPVLLPSLLHELSDIGYDVPSFSRVLFVTAMNSIQLSLLTSMNNLGISCAALTKDNVDEVLESKVKVLLIGPEVLKMKNVTKSLLKVRSSFSLKVIDEAHLGMYYVYH